MKEELKAIVSDLRGLLADATPGVWGKGISTHHTVSRRPGQEPYRIAEFHHARDAAFLDFAHAHMPALLDEIERLSSPPAQAEQSGWMPIETAPTMKVVLVCDGVGYVGRAIKDLDGLWNHIGKPTHWMPLPTPPVKGQA